MALLRRKLEAQFRTRQEFVDALTDRTDTVDRFQGSQADVVIVCLTTCDGVVSALLLDERRLNVALTRAKKKLIVVGAHDVLKGYPLYYRLFETLRDTSDGDWLVRWNGAAAP